jgi:beta-glucosidase
LQGQALDEPYAWNGAWSRTWQGVDTLWDRKNAGPSLRDVLGKRFSLVPATTGSKAALVMVLAEKPSTEKPGDIHDLSLRPDEIEEARLWCRQHNGPKILVLVQNRPRLLNGLDTLFDAVLLANQPGATGTQALADLLAGDYSPSGKLPYTYPAHPHSLLTYDHKWTERLDPGFGMDAFRPAFAFGAGQGFWPVRYENVRLVDTVLRGMDAVLRLEVSLYNTGPQSQRETVLVMVGDSVASVTPSFRRLRDFRSVELGPGERRQVQFSIPVRDLRFVGKDMEYVLEKGWLNATVQSFNLPFRWEP